LNEQVKARSEKITVGRTFPPEWTADPQREVASGHVRGKIVVKI